MLIINNDDKKVIELVTEVATNLKAEDIKVIYVGKISSLIDYVVIATARSEAHAIGLIKHLRKQAKNNNITVLGLEGEKTKQWLLMDLGNIVVHVMLEQVRNFYQLEKLWEDMVK